MNTLRLGSALCLTVASFALMSFAAPAAQHDQKAQDKLPDIVETATSAGSFNTLLAAAKAAGLVDALKSKGPLTVLAPTDEAFAALGKDTIANLLKPENKDTLQTILKYHVISGSIDATTALKAGRAATLAGPELSFGLKGGRLIVNGAINVVNNDIFASNGVIHVIDQVLLPPEPKPAGRLLIGFFSERPGEELANYLGVDRNATLLVSQITKDSEAQKAGLRPYDLIVSINGRAASTEVISEEKEKAGFGGTLRLQILRRGTKVTVDTKVGAEGK